MPVVRALRPFFVLLVLASLAARVAAQDAIPPSAPYGEAVVRLERWIARELDAKDIPGLSIALVDGARIVWARGFGFADLHRRIPATAETVYRVGSVSKLFTDIAVMQRVEQGAIDLDAPVARYVPEFAPANTSGKPITLRQLMSHRSGLVREPPVGHYFDPTSPTIAATVASLNHTALVYPPESRTKYSNAGVTVVGFLLERTAGEPFGRAIQRVLLDPLRLESTSFEATPRMAKSLAQAEMWTYDGRSFPAPTFALGTAPAGNLYSTVLDLGRFLKVLFAGGRLAEGSILRPETLAQMMEPQFAKPGDERTFGLGFALAELDGHRRIGHGGAIYGFATELAALPDEKLGVVAIANRDCANAVVRELADHALRLLIAVKHQNELPRLENTSRLSPAEASRLEGRYGNASKGVDLARSARSGRVSLALREGGSRAEVRRQGDTLIVDGLLAHGPKLALKDDGARLVAGADTFSRTLAHRPDAPPDRWKGLIGEYGWDHNVLYIYEDEGVLHALIEWFFAYPLEEVSPDVFRFPGRGLYDGESLRFTRGADGRATQVVAAEVTFRRRPIEGEDGATFRIKPLHPTTELRAAARADQPPRENGPFRTPELVDIAAIEPGIKLDIRYATSNNFLGTALYSSPRAFLQRPVAEAVGRVHRALGKSGYGILIHDAYRPWYVTKMFWEATPQASRNFVANPAKGSRHNRGCAIDLTLYSLDTGEPVPMVGGYDEFSDRSNPDYPGGTSLQRWHRDLLRRAMEAEGFTVNPYEWWHFDFKDWPSYPILNVPFEEIAAGRP